MAALLWSPPPTARATAPPAPPPEAAASPRSGLEPGSARSARARATRRLRRGVQLRPRCKGALALLPTSCVHGKRKPGKPGGLRRAVPHEQPAGGSDETEGCQQEGHRILHEQTHTERAARAALAGLVDVERGGMIDSAK